MPSYHVLVNGIIDGSPGVSDRGLAYGDGLFETIRISRRTPLLWPQHRQRLLTGCQRLDIPFDQRDQQLLETELHQLCQAMTETEGILKVILTRGAGGRGYRATADLRPQRILIGAPLPQFPEAHRHPGIELFLCQTRLPCNPRLAGMKHLNRIEQVLARNEWQDQFAEGLVRDYSDRVIEGTMSNLFLIQDNELCTPALESSGVEGVIRNLIINRAEAEGVGVRIGEVVLADVESADSLFVTNSLIGLWPVRRFRNREYSQHPLVGRIIDWIADEERRSSQQYAAVKKTDDTGIKEC